MLTEKEMKELKQQLINLGTDKFGYIYASNVDGIRPNIIIALNNKVIINKSFDTDDISVLDIFSHEPVQKILGKELAINLQKLLIPIWSNKYFEEFMFENNDTQKIRLCYQL